MRGVHLQRGALSLVAGGAAEARDGVLPEDDLPTRMRPERLPRLLSPGAIDPEMAGHAPIDGQDRLLELVDRQAFHDNLFDLRRAALDGRKPPLQGRHGRIQLLQPGFDGVNVGPEPRHGRLSLVEQPIHLLFISTGGKKASVSHPRNLIVIGKGSQVSIVENYVGLGGGNYFTNAVTEIVVGENAVADHYKLQRESDEAFHVATQQVCLERNGNVSSHSISLGGALVRNDVNVVLDGEGGECTLNGFYMVSGDRHVDNHTRIDHVKPHGTSRQLYKGVLDGRSRGVFNGKIYVHKGAEKTDARQTNNNLLLSLDALIDTKPQLEIYNNDVKCTHGSTIGQLDQDAIFYLRSRGIGVESARRLLTYAFASDVIGRIRIDSVRAQLDKLLAAKFQKDS